jgi:hypothetical protein
MLSLRNSHRPSDRTEYVPEYPGFEALFHVPLEAAPRDAHIKWPDHLHQLAGDGEPQARLFHAMDAALRRLDTVRNDFDVVLVHFPDSWSPATRGKFFDAHDALKALGAKYNIPTQVLNDRAFTFAHKASLAWRLATALYVKAAGTPWKLAPLKGVPADTAYIGLAYALRGDQRDAHYVTCCSQVFDMDGGGMQFVAFEARDPVADVAEARRNPFLSRDDMRAVVSSGMIRTFLVWTLRVTISPWNSLPTFLKEPMLAMSRLLGCFEPRPPRPRWRSAGRGRSTTHPPAGRSVSGGLRRRGFLASRGMPVKPAGEESRAAAVAAEAIEAQPPFG